MRTHLGIAAAAVLLLAGCSAPGPADPPPGGASPDVPCIVGTWTLDVADYAAQSEEYVLGLGLPIEGFAMDGAGTITFTADGLVAADIALETSGTIVAGETRVPFTQPSVYSSSGDWASGSDPDTIDVTNWANIPDAEVPVDPESPEVPTIDFTDIPTVDAPCTASTLSLQAPGAPIAANWVR